MTGFTVRHGKPLLFERPGGEGNGPTAASTLPASDVRHVKVPFPTSAKRLRHFGAHTPFRLSIDILQEVFQTRWHGVYDRSIERIGSGGGKWRL